MSRPLPRVLLAPGRERSLERRHPWIFKGAIRSVEGEPGVGDTVEIRAHDGRWLALAAYSPASQIAARVWTFERDATVDEAFLEARVRAALARRADLLTEPDGGCRLIFGEADELPGLIVDRYADQLVLQVLAAGAERWRDALVAALQAALPDARIYERSDASVRGKEGLPQRTGPVVGDAPAGPVEIQEDGARFQVDVERGHKTGFYLDQRDARAWLSAHASGKDVLNVFAYTGAFGVVARTGGAAGLTQVDSSADALEAAERHLALNGVATPEDELVRGDAFEVLRRFAEEGRQWDVVVLDPPKFIESKAQLQRGARGYKDINRVALACVRPGGTLLTFSCSGLLEPDLFQKIVADAALDAGRTGRIRARLFQGRDHPVLLPFPESAYLKGLVVRVEG
ncbi:MAG: class I SAM-dependent methyltransferase [Gemmatimonadota bacterium]